ncbi:hypothetical protein B0H13DRAFT_2003541 [Mycena leptocephala]|nr:hypothetical protein B0H13DRAFT_2003541 [Mycena leptocephala]
MEDTSAKNGWQPSTAIADDLEALYAQSEIEKTKFAEKLAKKPQRKRKHGALDTAVPAVVGDGGSGTTNLPRTRRSCRIAESAPKPEGSTRASVEPRSRDSTNDPAGDEVSTLPTTDIAVMGSSEAVGSPGSKRCRTNIVTPTSRPETLAMNDAAYGRGNAHLAAMRQNDGSSPIGFLESSEVHNTLAPTLPSHHISSFAITSAPPTLPPIPHGSPTSECANCHCSRSTRWRTSKLEIGWKIYWACYSYEGKHQKHRPLRLEDIHKERRTLYS